MQLWSGVLSPFSAKVRIALAEKGLDYEVLEVPWSRETLWGPKPPEFLAVSPRGEVPVLLDGELSLYDSTVIGEYLEERYPEPPLMPGDPLERARCRQLEDEADEAMKLHVTPLVRELFTRRDAPERDAAAVAAGSEGVRRYYAGLEKRLAGREYLCGAFGLADVAAFMVLAFASAMGVAPGDEHARLRAWFERVRGRPSVAAEFEAMTRAAASA